MTTAMQCVSGPVNMNQRVRLKLTERGKKLYRDRHRIRINHPIADEANKLVRDDPAPDDGVVEMQLWEAFYVFGPEFSVPGMGGPFELTFELLELH
jgi:hypothetical protein